MSNVAALPGCTIPSVEPVQNVVDLLEEALRKARSGKLQGVAIVMVERDPDAFENVFYSHRARHTLAAGVVALNWQIGRRMVEPDE